MQTIIVGAIGAVLLVLTPLYAYIGYRLTRRKWTHPGRTWWRYGVAFEILAVMLLSVRVQAIVSGDAIREALAFANLMGTFAFVLIFASASYSHWTHLRE